MTCFEFERLFFELIREIVKFSLSNPSSCSPSCDWQEHPRENRIVYSDAEILSVSYSTHSKNCGRIIGQSQVDYYRKLKYSSWMKRLFTWLYILMEISTSSSHLVKWDVKNMQWIIEAIKDIDVLSRYDWCLVCSTETIVFAIILAKHIHPSKSNNTIRTESIRNSTDAWRAKCE